MFQEFYANSEHLIWPLVGLLLFVLMFVGVLAYVFLGLRDQDKVDRIASLPLAADTAADTAEHGDLNLVNQADGRANS